MNRLTRRRFIRHTAPITLVPWLGGCDGPSSGSSTGTGDGSARGAIPDARWQFIHGVASGDPIATAVILWTRVTPAAPEVDAGGNSSAPPGAEPGTEQSLTASVEWRIALDAEFAAVVAQGVSDTDAELDFTVKVDVQGLAPSTTYHYQFRVADAASPVGRTRTLPVGPVERARIAVTSCANYPYGYFHAYRKIAERSDLDLVLYLGDYIYEFGNGGYGNGTPIGRVPDPDREIISLEDYRRRHAQYKLDPDLQEVHRQHPAVAVWDDHEVADNAWRDGAKNHQPGTEGDWQTRKQAAMRAFHEWLPIRPVEPGRFERIYRSFALGDLIDLIMLDTRLIGRDRNIDEYCDPAQANDPARSLLGAAQEAWFFGELASSRDRGARWRLVGQQVAFSQFLADPPVAGCIGSVDKWSAYGASRTRVLDAIEAGAIDNVVILTGDAHSSWGLDVARDPFDPAVYDPATGRGSLAVELIGPGVTSPAIENPAAALASELRYKTTHPHLKFTEQHDQGYFIVEVTAESLRAAWYFVSPVREPGASERSGGGVIARAGENRLTLDSSSI